MIRNACFHGWRNTQRLMNPAATPGHQPSPWITRLRNNLPARQTSHHPSCGMRWKRKVHGGILGFIGFMLSPLSWWNDAFVNLPLALGFGWLVALVHRPAFEGGVIFGYWLTNVLGLVLLHKGVKEVTASAESRGYTWTAF